MGQGSANFGSGDEDLDHEDILGQQRASNAQSAADTAPAVPVESESEMEGTAPGRSDASSFPQPPRDALDAVRGNGPHANDTGAEFWDAVNEGVSRGILPTERPRSGAEEAQQQAESGQAQDRYQRELDQQEHARQQAAHAEQVRQRSQDRTAQHDATVQKNAADAAASRAYNGQISDFKKAGGLTEHDAEGNVVPKYQANPQAGAVGPQVSGKPLNPPGQVPVFKEGIVAHEEPTQRDGQWYVPRQDTLGNRVMVPVDQSPHFHEDPVTGAQTYRVNGEEIALGVNQNSVDRNKLKSTQADLLREEQQQQIDLTDARQRLRDAKGDLEPFNKPVKDAQTALAALQRQLPLAKSDAARKVLTEQIAVKQKVLQDPNYVAAQGAYDSVEDEVSKQQQSILEKRNAALEVARSLDRLKAARMLPPNTQFLTPGGPLAVKLDDQGRRSVDAVDVEALAAGRRLGDGSDAKNGKDGTQAEAAPASTSNLQSYRETLEGLQKKGVQVVGNKPIGDEIKRAKDLERRANNAAFLGATGWLGQPGAGEAAAPDVSLNSKDPTRLFDTTGQEGDRFFDAVHEAVQTRPLRDRLADLQTAEQGITGNAAKVTGIDGPKLTAADRDALGDIARERKAVQGLLNGRPDEYEAWAKDHPSDMASQVKRYVAARDNPATGFVASHFNYSGIGADVEQRMDDRAIVAERTMRDPDASTWQKVKAQGGAALGSVADAASGLLGVRSSDQVAQAQARAAYQAIGDLKGPDAEKALGMALGYKQQLDSGQSIVDGAESAPWWRLQLRDGGLRGGLTIAQAQQFLGELKGDADKTLSFPGVENFLRKTVSGIPFVSFDEITANPHDLKEVAQRNALASALNEEISKHYGGSTVAGSIAGGFLGWELGAVGSRLAVGKLASVGALGEALKAADDAVSTERKLAAISRAANYLVQGTSFDLRDNPQSMGVANRLLSVADHVGTLAVSQEIGGAAGEKLAALSQNAATPLPLTLRWLAHSASSGSALIGGNGLQQLMEGQNPADDQSIGANVGVAMAMGLLGVRSEGKIRKAWAVRDAQSDALTGYLRAAGVAESPLEATLRSRAAQAAPLSPEADAAKTALFGRLVQGWAKVEADPKTFADRHDAVNALRGAIEDARNRGDLPAMANFKDQLEAAQKQLGNSAAMMLRMRPGLSDQMMKLVAPDADAGGIQRELSENDALRLASVEIGRRMQPFYLNGGRSDAAERLLTSQPESQAPTAAGMAKNLAAMHQMIGAHAVLRDLVGVLQGGKITADKAAAFVDLGLLRPHTLADGNTELRLTDDGVALLPKALREKHAAPVEDPEGHPVSVTPGNTGAIANNLVRAGEDRLRIVADAERAGQEQKQAAVDAADAAARQAGLGKPAPATDAGENGQEKPDGKGKIENGKGGEEPAEIGALREFHVPVTVEMPGIGTRKQGVRVQATSHAEAVKKAVAQAERSAPKGAVVKVGGKPEVVPEVELPEAPKAKVDDDQAHSIFQRVLGKWRLDLHSLGVEHVEEYGDEPGAMGTAAVDDAKMGPLALSRDTLLFHRGELAKLINARKGVTPEEAVEAHIVHELIHAAGNWKDPETGDRAVSFQDAKEIDETAPDALRVLAASAYSSWSRLSPEQRGYEYVRLVAEGRYRGKISEQIYRALEKVLTALGVKLHSLPENKLLREAVDRLKAVLDAHAIDITKTRVGGAGESAALDVLAKLEPDELQDRIGERDRAGKPKIPDARLDDLAQHFVDDPERSKLISDEMEARYHESEEAGLKEHNETASKDLLEAVMEMGGLPTPSVEKVYSGELAWLRDSKSGKRIGLFRADAEDLDTIRERLSKYGFEFDTVNDMLDALQQRMFDPDNKPVYGEKFGVDRGLGDEGFQGAAPVATDEDEPFYSQLTRTVQALPQETMTVGQARAAITKGAKPAEIQQQGILDDPLSPLYGKQPGDKVTKRELVGYSLERRARVQDVTLADGDSRYLRDANGNPVDDGAGGLVTRAGATHFGRYQLPGADEGSYREQFLTWPNVTDSDRTEELRENRNRTAAEQQEFERHMASAEKRDYSRWSDGHGPYSDIANPIVRIRRNLRTDAAGKRTYFLEEMQGPSMENQKKMPPELRSRIYEIGMKRAIRDAVDQGADAIGWTTGDQQAERYDLSKQVDNVIATPWPSAGDGMILLTAYNGPNQVFKELVHESKIESYVGKDGARKLAEQEPDALTGQRILEGDDLKVGGEGLKNLYDVMLPRIVKRLAEKLGGKVEKRVVRMDNDFPGLTKEESEPFALNDPIHSMDIPQAWKDAAPQFALYSAQIETSEQPELPGLHHESNVDRAAAATHPEPTDAQKEAGNYRKGHTRISGLDISIESPAGSTRSGEDKEGKPWSTTMGAHYGYIRGTEGRDGDHVDVMIKPGTPDDWRGPVYVVNQVDPGTQRFDEHKAILGAESAEDAKAIYHSNYSAGWNGLGSLEAMPFEAFKEWVKDPDNTRQRATTSAEAAPSVAELVKDNMGLAVSIANSYRNIPGIEFADILGEARKALVKAARGYEPQSEGKGAPFGSYAGTSIRNGLNNLFNKQTRLVDREGTSADVPSGEQSGPDGREGPTLKDQLVDPNAQAAVSSGIEGDETRAALEEAMRELPERVRTVLDLAGEGKSLREIGEAIGLSHEMARRILENGKKAVEAKLRAKGFEGVDPDGVLYSSPVEDRVGRYLEDQPGEMEAIRDNKGESVPFADVLSDLRRLHATGPDSHAAFSEYVDWLSTLNQEQAIHTDAGGETSRLRDFVDDLRWLRQPDRQYSAPIDDAVKEARRELDGKRSERQKDENISLDEDEGRDPDDRLWFVSWHPPEGDEHLKPFVAEPRIYGSHGEFYIDESPVKYASLDEAFAAAKLDVRKSVEDQGGTFGSDMDGQEAAARVFGAFPTLSGVEHTGWFRTKWGSWYLEGKFLEPDGEPGEGFKLTVRDHDVARSDMGVPDRSFEVSKRWDPEEVGEALKRAAAWLAKKATADSREETGGAGSKTPLDVGESGAPREQGDVRMANRATGATSLPTQDNGGKAGENVNPENRASSDGAQHSAAIARDEIAEEADRIQRPATDTHGEPPQQFLKDILARGFAGKLDALDHFVPGTKALLTDTHIRNARISSALRIFRERLQANVRESFGYPSWWRGRENSQRMDRFTAELLPTAARLNATEQDETGKFTFADFWMRAGELPGKQDKAMGMNDFRITLKPGVIVKGRHGEQLRVAEKVDTVIKGVKRSFWQLERFMPAADQARIHEDFHDKYPEAAHWLDSWINPNLRDSRVTIGGIDLPDFNRFSLHQFWGDISPFGPLAEVQGYTPDVFMTKSLVGMMASRVQDLLNRTWTGPGREYKTGEARERGQVRNLFEGFNERAAEAHVETQRKQLAEGLLSKALKLVPDSGVVPPGYVLWSTATVDNLMRLHPEAAGLTQTELALRRTTLRAQLGFGAAQHQDMMIHQSALEQLRAPLASQYINNGLLRVLNKGIRGATAGYLANPFTVANYQLSEELFTTMHTLRKALEGLYSLPFDQRQGKLGLYEAGNLMKGMLTDRWYNPRIRELIPDEIFHGNHRFTTVAPHDFDKSPAELLADLNVTGAALKVLRFGNIDVRAKQRIAFASMMAHGRLAWDDAKADGQIPDGTKKGEWLRDWVQTKAGPEVWRQAYDSAVLIGHDYANVPPVLDEGHQWTLGGHDITPIVNTLRPALVPFAKYPYNLIRQGKRFTSDSLRDLLPGNAKIGSVDLTRGRLTSPQQKRAAAANLTMMSMLFLLARHLMSDDEEGTPQLGREMDDLGKKLDSAYSTKGRVNITHTPMGRTITAALDMFGLHDVAEQDKWMRIRAIPYASSAAALSTLTQPQSHEMGENVHAVFADMVNEGILAKMINAVRGEDGPFDQGKNLSYIAAENAFDLVTGRFLPPPLLHTAAALVDPTGRRSRPNPSLDYDPGAVEAIRNKIPGLASQLPTSGTVRVSHDGSPKAEEAIAESIARELPAGNFRRYVDPKDGRSKVAYVMPSKVQVPSRAVTLLRQIGLNIKFVDHDEYVRELGGIPELK